MKLAKDLQIGDKVYVLHISNEIDEDIISNIENGEVENELLITYKSGAITWVFPNYKSVEYGLNNAKAMFSKEALKCELIVRKSKLEKEAEDISIIIENL